MNLDLIKKEEYTISVKYFPAKHTYYSGTFYTHDLNYELPIFSNLENGMRIIIPDSIKKDLLIRKINKYFKDNSLDVKIVNDINEANTICLTQELLPSRIADLYLNYKVDTNNEVVIDEISYSNKNHYAQKIKRIEFYYNAGSKLMKVLNTNNHEDLLVMFTDKYKFLSDVVLSDITTNQYILDSADIEINSHKLKSMLVEENSCKILCAALKNRNLSEYMKDIIDAYYLTDSGACRTLIRTRLLMRYKEADKLIQFGDSYNHSNNSYKPKWYMRTMKDLNMEADKEIVLELVGYYK